MVLRTPKAQLKYRRAGQYDLGTCAHRLARHRETEDRAREQAPHMLG